MEDEEDVQGADKDRMGFVCGPAGRRCGRESVAVRKMVELKEESEEQTNGCQPSVLHAAGQSTYDSV